MTDKWFRLKTNWCSLLFALLVISVSVSVGCDRKEPMGMLSGSVSSKGKACGNCQLEIFDPASLRSIGATVNDQGTFELKDVPFGEYQIAVLQVLDPHDPGDPPPDKRIPEKYRDGKTSGITVSVNSVEEVVLKIEMD